MPRLLGFSVGEYVKALECAKAYLLLHPDDEDVLDNVDYYEGLLDGSTDPASIEAREVRPRSGAGRASLVSWLLSRELCSCLWPWEAGEE